MTYNTYIFDLDGTLLDTLGDLAAATNYALRQKLMERAIPDGAHNPDFEATFATFRQYYMQHSLDTTQPYEGISETLAALKAKGCRLAVVSNKMMAATQELCQHFFPDTIEVAIGENEAAGIRKKPAPDTVYAALDVLGEGKGNAVYVGDSDVDIQTAANAGLPCISVLWGFRDKAFLTENGAKTFISTPSELL